MSIYTMENNLVLKYSSDRLRSVLVNPLKVSSCMGFNWVVRAPVNPSKVRSFAGFIEESSLDEFK